MGGSRGSGGGEKCIQCKHCGKEVEGKRTFQVYVDDIDKADLNEIGFAYVNFFQLAHCRFE